MSQNKKVFSAAENLVGLVSKCDELIREGRIGEVTSLLSKLNFAKVHRSQREALAKICRRSGLIEDGLRLLQPIIRNEKKLIAPPSLGEICEYAVLLSRNGSISEALALLATVDRQVMPNASLYLAFCYISSWDYVRASYYLNHYLDSDVDSYSKMIARVNLASSLVALGRLDEALDFLTETIALGLELRAHRLVGNCLELRGQTHILQGDFNSARIDLEEAFRVFGGAQSYDQLLTVKWQSIMRAFEQKSIEPLRTFRVLAFQRKHWESVRESDLFSLKICFDQSLFDHLYFGTSATSYKRRIIEQLEKNPSDHYIWGSKDSQILDLDTGKILGSNLNAGKKVHQILTALLRDFYQPRNIGTLFSELYPEEYFNVDSSPLRVHQLLSRTRKWLKINHLVLNISSLDRAYQLESPLHLGIRIPMELKTLDSDSIRVQELQKYFSLGVTFKMKEARERLQISKTQFHRVIGMAIAKGLVMRTGVGKNTLYQFSAPVLEQKVA